jgi:hypothetical protein
MKSPRSKKKARSPLSKTKGEPTGGTELVCTSSRPMNIKEPAKLRASQSNLPQTGGAVADLLELVVSFSTPTSIRDVIYGRVSRMCERNVRAETTDETLVYKKLAQQLPFYLELTDAQGIINCLISSEDPLKAWLHLETDFQLFKLRTSKALLEEKVQRCDASKVKANAPNKSSNSRRGRSLS